MIEDTTSECDGASVTAAIDRTYTELKELVPAEALSEPLFRIWHFFWRVKNKKNLSNHGITSPSISLWRAKTHMLVSILEK